MKKILFGFVCVFSLLLTTICLGDVKLAEHLQDISVTVKSGTAQGSGVLITRKVLDNVNTKEAKEYDVNFVWTAGHVVDNLRSIREFVDVKTGTMKKVVEFRDAEIVQELIEGGRRVGEFKMNAKVIKYSDANLGDDLALLMVRKRGLKLNSNTKFLLEGDQIVPVGTELYHVGSLLGQVGSNSFLSGTMSQLGRTIELNNGEAVVFNQVQIGAMPGSSGGGVFLKSNGQYVGMLVRGASESFALIVPVDRMFRFCDKQNIKWAMDEKEKVPDLKDILNLPVE